MECRDLQTELAFYGEIELPDEVGTNVEGHLVACPLCRERVSANREIRRGLAALRKEMPSVELADSIRFRLREELRNGPERESWFATDVGVWFQHRLMPYAVGAMVTLLVGFVTLNSLLLGLRADVGNTLAATSVRNATESVMLATSRNPYAENDADAPILAAEYALLRRDVSTESPSLNPHGSLISLSGSLVNRSDGGSEGVVVVADVLSNGIARIREVVDPVRNRRVLRDLEKAFEAELGDTPFVPARMDNRSESVRIVLMFQSVDVPNNSRRSARR